MEESQKYIRIYYFWEFCYLNFCLMRDHARQKSKIQHPSYIRQEKTQHSCNITDHNGENVIAFEDFVNISAN